MSSHLGLEEQWRPGEKEEHLLDQLGSIDNDVCKASPMSAKNLIHWDVIHTLDMLKTNFYLDIVKIALTPLPLFLDTYEELGRKKCNF